MEAFGWTYVDDRDFEAWGIFDEAMFYGSITNSLIWHGKCKNSSIIPHLALRFLHGFLTMNIFCHDEPTKMSKFDLNVFGLCTWRIWLPGFGWTFVDNCLEIMRKKSSKNSLGGMVTLLADYLKKEVPKDNDRKLILQILDTNAAHFCKASIVYNKEQLKKALML